MLCRLCKEWKSAQVPDHKQADLKIGALIHFGMPGFERVEPGVYEEVLGRLPPSRSE